MSNIGLYLIDLDRVTLSALPEETVREAAQMSPNLYIYFFIEEEA